MAADHLGVDRRNDVGDVEGADLPRECRMVNDLEQQVAELVAEIGHVVAIDRVRDLVGFLDRVRGHRAERLDPIPRASVRRAQPGDDLDQLLEARGGRHRLNRRTRSDAGAGRTRARQTRVRPGSDGDRQGFAALRRVDHPHGDGLALREMRDAGRPEDRDMNEHVLAAVVRLHEAKALVVVEPLDDA